MDIYIGGLHDRNRALNGDVVAVKIKPQSEWKVHWDRIHLWEERTKRSILEDLQGDSGSPDSGEGDSPKSEESSSSAAAPAAPLNSQVIEEGVEEAEAGKAGKKEEQEQLAEEELGGDELPDSPVPSQPNWDGSSPTAGASRPSDTIEVLGIERLLGQVQEYVESQRRNGNSRRHKSSGGGSSRPGRVPMPCSLEASLAPLPSALVATTLGGDPPRPPSRRGLEPSAADPHALRDPWADTDDMGSTMVFSPEELLEVPEGERRRHRRASSPRSPSPPAPVGVPPCVGAVAPDELSGEEDWSSDAESTGSTALERQLEDMAFLQASQDARNNNQHPHPGGAGGGAEDVCNNGPEDERLMAEIERGLSRLAGMPAQADGVSFPPDLSLPPQLRPGWDSVDGVVANGGWGEQPLAAWAAETHPPYGQHDAASPRLQEAAAAEGSVPVAPQVEDGPSGGSPMEKEEEKAGGAQQAKKKRKKKSKKKRLGATGLHSKGNQDGRLTVADVLRHPLAKRFVQRTGQVVHVVEARNSRVTAGCLRLLQDRNPNWVLFSPRDSRFPRLMVPAHECPPAFFERPTDFTSTLFLAEMTMWLPDSNFAQGRLRRLLGPTGDLCVETEALLESHNIDHGEFPPDIFGDLEVGPDWKVPEEELSGRRDFRGQLVFTVDPKTARDLDDAISCRPLPPATEGGEPLWEVGVHIADVSRFVAPGTRLDQVAQRRATSVYLVQQVVPMLPRLLCDHLCSLHPGEDKLTFSVVWSLNAEGRVRSEWFGRSVIRSCCKLSYEHAQDLLDNPERERLPGELPDISDGHTVAEVADCLRVLRGMTEAMRARRIAGGALRLDQVKVAFALTDNFVPIGFSVYEHTESHRLIEELMLLANMAVAHRLYKALPDMAFLRSHPPPDDTQLTEVDVLCKAHGVALDISSAGTLQASLNSLVGEGDELAHAKLNVLTHLLSKPMRMALYFCAGHREDPASFEHYALNVPLYTHFTSPIRRYADVMVHRQLAAALGCGPMPEGSVSELQQVADHCNDRKYKARQVQETSVELFLYAFVEQCGALDDRAMVVGVQEHCFDVLGLTTGMAKRVYCDKLGVQEFVHSTEGGRNSIELRYQSSRHADQYVAVKIEVFTPLEVRIVAQPHEPLKYQVFVKPPPDTVPVAPKMKDKPKGRPGRTAPKR
ncbi:DIS3-like exonuclease 2 isoform X2 [Haemaphysalis longicornis]